MKGMVGACVIASLFGVVDEWHQSFVPGRYASLTDVGFNLVGVALGLWLVIRLGSKARNIAVEKEKDLGPLPPA